MSEEGVAFRKASDTRALPEVPSKGREILDRMKKASEQAALSKPSSQTPKDYGPNLGPLNNPPLTASQASKLLDVSKFPSKLEKYRKQFIKAMVEYSTKLSLGERRSFNILLNLASNICSIESMSDSFNNLESRISNLETLDVSDEEKAGFVNNLFISGAIYLVNGYDLVDKAHFIFDETGKIIGINPMTIDRKPLCLADLKKKKMLEEQEGQFRKFLKDTSDPYKGSQQGTGKTRKQKKHSKKTRKHKRKL